ncbi:MAG: DUF3696 domain-containing protein, partial [Candidatus Kapaibacterium sp.]
MASNGQSIIAETHSEHLLIRLRRLIAEEKLKSDVVAIYFVQNEDHQSSIKQIKLQENGHINQIDWPKDFFADSLRESMVMASEQAKRK